MENENYNKIFEAFNALQTNQQVLNEKIDYILQLSGESSLKFNKFEEDLNNQKLFNNEMYNKINNLTNKLSDIQIEYQNLANDIPSFTNDLQNISNQIENIKQLLDQWKLYQSIY